MTFRLYGGPHHHVFACFGMQEFWLLQTHSLLLRKTGWDSLKEMALSTTVEQVSSILNHANVYSDVLIESSVIKASFEFTWFSLVHFGTEK